MKYKEIAKNNAAVLSNFSKSLLNRNTQLKDLKAKLEATYIFHLEMLVKGDDDYHQGCADLCESILEEVFEYEQNNN